MVKHTRLCSCMRHVTEKEFWIFFGILIAARIHGRYGSVWDSGQPEGQRSMVNYAKYMKQYRFLQIRDIISNMWASPEEKHKDDWWLISHCIAEFNENQKRQVNASFMKTLDESMSAFCPQSRATGNLPHLSFIMQKPESLGTEFKVAACPITGIMLFLEIQKGHEKMREALYSNQCGVTAACVLRLVEGSMRA